MFRIACCLMLLFAVAARAEEPPSVAITAGHHILTQQEADELNQTQAARMQTMLTLQDQMHQTGTVLDAAEKKNREHLRESYQHALLDYLWGEIKRLESCIGQLESERTHAP